MDIRTYIIAKNYTDKKISEAGLKGKDGKSAYEYAVEGGFQGTEQEFSKVMASASIEIYTVNAQTELPSEGNIDYIYRVINDAQLYQWNGTEYQSLSGVPAGISQTISKHENILQGIGGEGEPATVLEAIQTPATNETLGTVKLSDEISLNENGGLSLNQVNTDKLYQGEQELIFACGNALE